MHDVPAVERDNAVALLALGDEDVDTLRNRSV